MELPKFTHDPSLTSQFKPLGKKHGESENASKRVVVIGGGTGAPMSIRCLLSLDYQVSAVVAMADDGGSTGELRKQAGVTPPGDVRKCLAAFAAHPDDAFAQAFKYRFPFADNHALGNLLLAALEDASGSFPEAIEICEQLLQARGHVLPSTLTHVELAGQTRQGHLIEGQASVCHSAEPLQKVWLHPSHPGQLIEAYAPALDALEKADYIILGPGSLFTSIIANLLVPGIVEAIRKSHAYVVYVSNISDSQGETRGFCVKDQIEALYRHGMEDLINCVLADAPRHASHEETLLGAHRVSLTKEERRFLEALGIAVTTRDFYNEEHPGWHSVSALRSALKKVLQ